MADSIESLTREVQLAAEAFAPLGWAFFGHWPRKESERIRKLLEKGESARVVDEQITEVWNGDLEVLLRNIAAPLGRWGRGIDIEFQRRCQQRATLLAEAIACHQDGRYAAAIPLTLTQIDGLTREVVGTTFFRHNPGPEEPDYMDDETLGGIGGQLPVVRAAFSEPVNTVGRYNSVSRHAVIHGQDLSFANRVNSTKTLVLVGALIEHLDSQSEKRAKAWRRKRDLAKSKLTGYDETGRLNDDRGLEELYMFRLDLETKSYTDMYQHQVARSSIEEKAHELLEARRLSRRGFELTFLDERRIMWKFHSPGGQHLASAQEILDLDTRPIPSRQWTWDATEPPSSAPWDDDQGWTPTESEPKTPNWRFGGFFNG